MATYIFPDLVMKLIEKNFVVCNVVVSENVGARRVHILRVSEARGEKVEAKGERKGEGAVAPKVINNQHWEAGIKTQTCDTH